MTVAEWIALVVMALYCVGSYGLFIWCAVQDAKQTKTPWYRQLPPAAIVAPVFAPLVVWWLLCERQNYAAAAKSTYVCVAAVHPDDDGGFWVEALNLPGCVSQGETVHEALRNIHDAFAGCVLSYLDDGAEIPWRQAANYVAGPHVHRIYVECR